MRANLGLTEPEVKKALKDKTSRVKQILSEDYDKNSLYWKFSGGFLAFFIIGFLYVFVSMDVIMPFNSVQPKDYEAEEVQNLARVSRMDDYKSSPLVDEDAEQFVNDVDQQVEEIAEPENKETVVEPSFEPEEAVGEEF